MALKHLVVQHDENGNALRFPLKEWIRKNPVVLPNADTSIHTSHQIRGMLKKKGWTLEITDTEVLAFPPETDPAALDAYVEVATSDALDESDEPDSELSFELEFQLRDFLASNLNTIDLGDKRVHLFHDKSGRRGVEFPTGVGFVDVLAEDDDGALYVFELKRAVSPDRAVGQVARYMGWLKNNGYGDRKIYGVIVSKTVSEKLKYALDVIPNVMAFEYSINFSLTNVSLVAAV